MLPKSMTILRQPAPTEIEALREAGSLAMGVPVAPADVVTRILQRDPEALWVFETDGRITGGVAFLFLSETVPLRGMPCRGERETGRRLLLGDLSRQPDKRWNP
jgi:hypothetical protein